MSEEKTKLKNFHDIGGFLKNKEKNVDLYKALNNALIESINNKNGLTEIHREDKFSENDHSLETFLRRIVFECIKNKAGNLGVDIDDAFEKTSNFKYLGKDYSWHTPTFLNLGTTKAIFNFCKDNLFENKEKIDSYVFNCITELCQLTVKNENENKIFPLDLVIYSVNALRYGAGFNDIKAIFPFIDMGSVLYDAQNFSKEDIYKFFKNIPLSCFDMFLGNQQFVAKLGGINTLKNLLEIEKLENENENDENVQALVNKLHNEFKKIDFNNAKVTVNTGENTGIRIVDDEAYKQKVKKNLVIYQLPKSIASAIMFLFGIGLFLAAGFAWSVPFLLGIGFLIPSIAAFTNSILCMKPTKTRTWLAKIFKNCAWIIDGALLITLGAVFCAGPLAIAFITFGSLGILMGCFNAFVGTLNSMWDTQRELVSCEDAENDAASIDDIKSEILSHKIFNVVVFAIACAAGVFLALNPAILPIALPFLPGLSNRHCVYFMMITVGRLDVIMSQNILKPACLF